MGSFGRIKTRTDLPSKKILIGYIKQAMKLNEERVASPTRSKATAKSKEKPPLVVPGDLAAEFAKRKHAAARKHFDAFAYSHRKEYIEWITSAKRAETRATRIAKTLAQLAEGKSQNWKYER